MKKSRRGNIDFFSALSPEARAAREHVAEMMPPIPTPPTVRECLARGRLPYDFPPGRKSMSPVHQRELIERYPGLYRHADDEPVLSSAPFARFGFEVGDGWLAVIDRLSEKLVADPKLVVGQLKEKMGLLVIHFDVTELASPEVEAATDAAYNEAREESKRTCEVCGEPGAYKNRDHHIGPLCEPCDWLDDIVEACRCLACYPSKMDFAAFVAHATRLDACKRHVQHLGEAASHQSPERRARLPGIDWRRLDSFRAMTGVSGAPAMTAVEVWTFILEQVPVLVEALR